MVTRLATECLQGATEHIFVCSQPSGAITAFTVILAPDINNLTDWCTYLNTSRHDDDDYYHYYYYHYNCYYCVIKRTHLAPSVIFVNENENVEKRENNEFVNENKKMMKTKTKLKRKNKKTIENENEKIENENENAKIAKLVTQRKCQHTIRCSIRCADVM